MNDLTYLTVELIEVALMLLPIALIIWIAVKYANKKTSNTTQQQNQKSENVQLQPTQQSEQAQTSPTPEQNELPYILNQNFLTSKEYKFYQSLKPIANKYGLEIICKVRLADLVIIPKNINNYMKWFNRIKAKHIDFVLCSSEMKPVLLIEVDDYTHQWNNRQRRDEFVDSIFKGTAIKLLHILTWTNEQLEEQIKSAFPCPETEKES